MPKAERDAELRLADIVQAIERVRTYTTGMSFEAFSASQITFDAVVMNVLVIGESINHLPDRLKAGLGALPWKSIIALRNLVAHGYPELEERIIWDIAQTRLDDLEAVVRPMLTAIQRP